MFHWFCPVRWNACSMVWRFFLFRLGYVLWLHWSGLLNIFEQHLWAKVQKNTHAHRLQLGTPVHIDHIQSLNSTTEIHWDPGYAMCFCRLVHCTAWFLPSPSRHVGFLSRLPGISVSFEELTEAETPCRVTSWPWLIWLIGHYRIYRGLDYVILSWISWLIDVYSVLSSPTMEISINKAL